ncbi:MAG: hypothetical protein ABGY71_03650 [bacterium]|nr:hypothetical protein [Planctomycetota bacterium]HIL52632.1 hypothetical protein [Planctomycetota bacterium]
MSDPRPTLCFTCGMPTGQAAGEFPRLNTLSNGRPCPHCRDRLLEALPGIHPGEGVRGPFREDAPALSALPAMEQPPFEDDPGNDSSLSFCDNPFSPDEPA